MTMKDIERKGFEEYDKLNPRSSPDLTSKIALWTVIIIIPTLLIYHLQFQH